MLWTRRRQRRGNAANQQIIRQDPRDNNGNGNGGSHGDRELDQNGNNPPH